MSGTITVCQSCGSSELTEVFSLGWLPLVNTMQPIKTPSQEQMMYPAQLLQCKVCDLVQLGFSVDPSIVFPTNYSYRSGSTKLLRDNFADLAHEVGDLYPNVNKGFVIDIGCNDGELLSHFKERGWFVYGIEPTEAGQVAHEKGISVFRGFLSQHSATHAAFACLGKRGANVVTACNVFAHIPDPNEVVHNVLTMLADDGLFITESHYLLSMLEEVQYDVVYHEHLRFYSLTSLKNLLERHGLEILRVKRISTHGGSIRVYSARKGKYPVDESVDQMLTNEAEHYVFPSDMWGEFRQKVTDSKLQLLIGLLNMRGEKHRIFGVGCPSRAVTLINYVSLDETTIECVVEIAGSPKIGHFVPGTRVSILDESVLFAEQPEFVLLLSWHLADELMQKLRENGYQGKFIIPLPEPRIIE